MKTQIFIALFLFSSVAFANKTILMMVPNDFMWAEYSIPRNTYENAGYNVVVAGRFKELISPDRRNLLKGDVLYFSEAKAIQADLSFDQVRFQNFEAITFVGGNGAWSDFFPIDSVHKIVIETLKSKKILGLLCSSTGILAVAGNYGGTEPAVAQGKKVVGYYRVEGLLRNLGKVNYIAGPKDEPAVQIDGNLITGRNPQSSQIFAEEVVKALKSGRII